MAQQTWRRLALAGLVAAFGVTVGCNDRREGTVRDDARKVGQEVDEAAQETREVTEEALEGFREGVGGSGQKPREDDATIGDKPGVIHDGEGPIEERRR